jgi:hypothetical protein
MDSPKGITSGYWHKKIRKLKIHSLSKVGHNKRYAIKEDVASLILLYLLLGKDYTYNMAKEFSRNLTTEKGWKKEQINLLRSVKEQSQLQPILKLMSKKKFLIESKLDSEGRSRICYEVNPAIIVAPYYSDTYDSEYISEIYGPIKIPEDQIRQLLQKMEEKSREAYFRKWSDIPNLKFDAFLGEVKDEAREHEMHEMVIELIHYLNEIRVILPSEERVNNLQREKEFIEMKIRDEERDLKWMLGEDAPDLTGYYVQPLVKSHRIGKILYPIGRSRQ